MTITCAGAITAARQVTGTETPLATLVPSGGALTVSLGGYAPMTRALTLASPANLTATPVSVPVTLPFNLDAMSSDANRTNGNFYSGYTYPAELILGSIVRDGINFVLGLTNDGTMNALSCTGQVINLSGSGYDHLYLLASAASNNTTGTLIVNGAATNLTARYFTGNIGQWFPPAQTSDEVAWVCTHRHDSNGNNNAYNFCYLFKYRLDLPTNATSITLPNAPNFRIFAISLTKNTTPETAPAGGPLAGNLLPWAIPGPSRTINSGPGGNGTVMLDGSGSADPDGAVLSYVWSNNGSPLASGMQPVVSLPAGTNNILLTVTDNQGGIGQGIAVITVLPPLSATLTATPSIGSAPLAVQFTGQASGVLAGLGPIDTTDDHQGTITAQGDNSPNESATNAFDNKLASKWLDFGNAYTNIRSTWIQYQYASGGQRVVTNYTITSANDAANYPARNPMNWRLLGSNNNGTNWTTLDTQLNRTFSSSQQTLAWGVTNATAYNIYRLVIDGVSNPPAANSMQLDEIQFIGPLTYNYFWMFGDGTTSILQNPQHTFGTNGNYLVTLAVSCGLYTGTNTILITVGMPLTSTITATPTNGAAPLAVQFTAQASGGNGGRTPYDTTTDHYGLITAQGDNPPNEVMAAAFDNKTATKWLDFANANPTTRSSWIQYQYAYGATYAVSQYALTTANDHPERDPQAWRLLGSNDGGMTWDTLSVETNVLTTNRLYRTVFTISPPAGYNIYQLKIDRVANAVGSVPTSANSMQLSELELIGNPSYTYSWLFGDGFTSTLQNPQHTFATGAYSVVMVASDRTAFTTNTITINSRPLVLTATPLVSGSLAISWPTWAVDLHLYATTNLVPPISWWLVTNAVATNGGNCQVTLPAGSGSGFFQLRNP